MTSFTKPPLTSVEKEKKAQEFINFVQDNTSSVPVQKKSTVPSQKEDVKAMIVRMPASFKDDIVEISVLTGLGLNAVCLELLRSGAKKKLKELRED
jgi:hypothetical protein